MFPLFKFIYMIRIGNLLLGTNDPYLLFLAVELGRETDIPMLHAPSPQYYCRFVSFFTRKACLNSI